MFPYCGLLKNISQCFRFPKFPRSHHFLGIPGFPTFSRTHINKTLFGKNTFRQDDCFGPTHNSKLFNKKTISFNNMCVCLIRFAYVSRVRDSQKYLIGFPKSSRFHHFLAVHICQNNIFKDVPIYFLTFS